MPSVPEYPGSVIDALDSDSTNPAGNISLVVTSGDTGTTFVKTLEA